MVEVPDVPAPRRSLLHCLAFLVYLWTVTPVRRLLGYEPIVPESSIRTEIGVRFIRYSIENSLEGARAFEAATSKLVSMSVPDKLTPVEDDGIRGVWIGDEYESGHDGSNEPVIVYFHGGGYSTCSALTYVTGLSGIRKALKKIHNINMRIFSLEYSLAPESKYPTQLNEAIAAIDYVAKEYPNRPIILMGDSAGGNLVLAVLQTLKKSPSDKLPWLKLYLIHAVDKAKELKNRVSAAILISPWVDIVIPPTSHEANHAYDFTSIHTLKRMTQWFLPDGADVKDPLLSPVFADLSGFCPMFIHYGGRESFASDIERFIEAAKKARPALSLDVFVEPKAPHITPMMPPFFPDMAERGHVAIAHFVAKLISS
ncbi:Alpha/beta hydrolase fold-3 domain-containing protein [Plasmodiophora brassicae]